MPNPFLVLLAVQLASLPGESALRAARSIREAIERHHKPILIAWSGRRRRAEAAYALLEEGHVPIYESPVRVAEAGAWLARFAASRSATEPLAPPTVVRVSLPPSGGALDEARGKALLTQAGIPVACEVVLPGDVERPASLDLPFPVAVKVLSGDIAHKSEAGGVKLGVNTMDELVGAIRTIRANVTERRPDATIDGFIVAEMITDGLEAIIGVLRDPSFGPVVAFGLGGVAAEVLKDVSYRVAPFGVDQARAMIGGLRSTSLFGPFRGRGALDVEALADAIARVSVLAAQEQRIVELDINPLFVRPLGKGVVAADALVVTTGEL